MNVFLASIISAYKYSISGNENIDSLLQSSNGRGQSLFVGKRVSGDYYPH